MLGGAGSGGTSVEQPDQDALSPLGAGGGGSWEAGAWQDPPESKSPDSSAVLLARGVHQHPWRTC